MVPFVPYFLGQQSPPSSRLASIQRCVRVGGKDSDLENIGRTPRHLSCFEMLGNFSFGDYFKEEAICWAWELLTEVYRFSPDQLLVSVFAGDELLGADSEAKKIWTDKIGLPESRIWELGKADNFWGPPGGVSGPCGPCSEIYFVPADGSEPVEIWNLVFMQYEKLETGQFKPLPKPNVDTGAGLERLASILQDKPDVFHCDLLFPLLEKVQALSRGNVLSLEDALLAQKIVTDHLRCSALLIADGVLPNNLGRGYVLRMLIRRAARFARKLGIEAGSLAALLPVLPQIYPSLEAENLPKIAEVLLAEEEAFAKTIERGFLRFEELTSKAENNIISGAAAFDLYATYGFPIEISLDLAAERGLSIDQLGFEQAKNDHAQASNQGKFKVALRLDSGLDSLAKTEFLGYQSQVLDGISVLEVLEPNAKTEQVALILDKTPFYAESGGQVADRGALYLDEELFFTVQDVQKRAGQFLHFGCFAEGLESAVLEGKKLKAKIDTKRRHSLKQHHTATHLVQAALRLIVGSEVQQAGSLVESNKLRFDFSFPRGLKPNELEQVEKQVNAWIEEDLLVETKVMNYEQALAQGALALFGEKYEAQVRVLSIGSAGKKPVSVELCGGTHVSGTGEIQGVSLLSETAISAGKRRISFLAGASMLEELRSLASLSKKLAGEFKVAPDKLDEKIEQILEQKAALERQIKDLGEQKLQDLAKGLSSTLGAENAYTLRIDESGIDLGALVKLLQKSQSNTNFFLYSPDQSNPKYCFALGSEVKTSASDLAKTFNTMTGSRGGGNKQFAQGSGGDFDKYPQAVREATAGTGLNFIPIK